MNRDKSDFVWVKAIELNVTERLPSGKHAWTLLEAKFYLQTRVPGGKVSQFFVLSRELHASPMKITRDEATSGGDKSMC